MITSVGSVENNEWFQSSDLETKPILFCTGFHGKHEKKIFMKAYSMFPNSTMIAG